MFLADRSTAMSIPRLDILDLDERTARLGREWFAEARKASDEEVRRAKRHRPGTDRDGDGDGLFSRLFGDGDADDTGGCGGED